MNVSHTVSTSPTFKVRLNVVCGGLSLLDDWLLPVSLLDRKHHADVLRLHHH